MSLSPSRRTLTVRWIALEEVRRLPPLPSGYVTGTVLRLIRSSQGRNERWTLAEVPLATPLQRRYDRGTADEWLASYLDEGSAERMVFLIAERSHELLGLLAARTVEWNRSLWLLDIRVRREVRRSGVGSELMSELKRYARGLPVRGVLVETQTSNVPAIRFYQKHGFIICGFNDHLYGNDDLENQEVAVYLFWESDAAGVS